MPKIVISVFYVKKGAFHFQPILIIDFLCAPNRG